MANGELPTSNKKYCCDDVQQKNRSVTQRFGMLKGNKDGINFNSVRGSCHFLKISPASNHESVGDKQYCVLSDCSYSLLKMTSQY